MKKLMLVAMLFLGTSAAFAGDSEPLKQITKSKDYAEAVQLLKQNLSQLANAQEKAKAYDHVTRLALKKFDAEGNIQALNLQAQITKGKEQPFDTLGYYEAAYNATLNGVECFKYDVQPDEKGKVKPKFISSLGPLVANARQQLVNAGNMAAQKGDADGVLKYWGTFLDTDDNDAFKEGKANEAQYLGQVAYFTAQYAAQAEQYERSQKYAQIAMQDKEVSKQAESLYYAVVARTLKTHADSLNYAQRLKGIYDQNPADQGAFDNLSNMYSALGMTDELSKLIDDKLAKDPNNFTAWAMKGQSLLNKDAKEQNANWDECIDCFKKAVNIDGTNPIVLTYLGFALNAKASALNDQAAQKQIYQEATKYLESAKNYDPNREMANWAYPLYQCYYQLYGADDSRTKELEQMLK